MDETLEDVLEIRWFDRKTKEIKTLKLENTVFCGCFLHRLKPQECAIIIPPTIFETKTLML